MMILTKDKVVDLKFNRDTDNNEIIYSEMKKCKECGKPYVKNNMLPKEMIDILGDKISYIPSCNCHETYYERQLEKMDGDIVRERLVNKGNRYKNISIMDERFLEARFENGNCSVRHTAFCKKYAEQFMKKSTDGGIILYGSSGVGKTFSSACMANYLMERGKSVLALNLGLYLNKLKLEWSKAETEILEKVGECDLLIIDDFGAEKVSEWVLEKVFLLIDARYRVKKPMIITTNLDYVENVRCEFTEKFGARVKSRVQEMCYPCYCGEKNMRMSGREKMEIFFQNNI